MCDQITGVVPLIVFSSFRERFRQYIINWNAYSLKFCRLFLAWWFFLKNFYIISTSQLVFPMFPPKLIIWPRSILINFLWFSIQFLSLLLFIIAMMRWRLVVFHLIMARLFISILGICIDILHPLRAGRMVDIRPALHYGWNVDNMW